MELNGKKINFLGDSITEGVGVSTPDRIFWALLGKATGATVRGYGISGSRIARQLTPDVPVARHDRHFATRVEEMDPDTDIIVVFGGTNDYGHGDAPLGTMADREDGTFYGAMHDLCQKLPARYPTATVVFVTPLHRIEENKLINERGLRNVTGLEGYRAAIREVAAYYGMPVFNWEQTTGIQPEIPEVAARYMPDGLHPSDDGNAVIASRLKNFMELL